MKTFDLKAMARSVAKQAACDFSKDLRAIKEEGAKRLKEKLTKDFSAEVDAAYGLLNN